MKKQLSMAKGSLLCILFCVVLLVILTACSGSGSTVSASSPTLKPTTKPAPTSTPMVIGKLFKGNGFTIDVPADWAGQNAAQGSSTGSGFASNTDSNLALSIVSTPVDASSNDALDLNTVVANEQKSSTSFKLDKSVSPNAEVGSESWVQVGSLITVNGANAKVIYLGKTHAGKFYLITLVDAAQNFDKTNQQFFQPALKTFKWA